MAAEHVVVVQLNVGGCKYDVGLDTLSRYPETFLASLLRHDYNHRRDGDGRIFIDRSGAAFELVLQFLRTERVNPALPDASLFDLLCEADFYAIAPLKDTCERMMADRQQRVNDDRDIQSSIESLADDVRDISAVLQMKMMPSTMTVLSGLHVDRRSDITVAGSIYSHATTAAAPKVQRTV